MIIKQYIQRFLKRCIYGAKCDSPHYIAHLRKKGIYVGAGSLFYDPISNVVDETNPVLLRIGENVRITHGVVILTHDYSWSVIAGKYGECLGGVAPVTIGDNVFIGMNSIITKGVTIGDNIIIGAGSVVTHDCDSDSVYAGIPAKKIMSLSQYREKKKSEQISDMKRIIKICDDKDMLIENLREYSPMFMSFDSPEVQTLFYDTGYLDTCNRYYKENTRLFSDVDELELSLMEDG